MPFETLEHQQWKMEQKSKYESLGYQVIEELPVNDFGNEKFDLVAKKGNELIILEYDRGTFSAQTFRNLYKGIHLKPTKIVHYCKQKRTAILSFQYAQLIKKIISRVKIDVYHNSEKLSSSGKGNSPPVNIFYDLDVNHVRAFYKDQKWGLYICKGRKKGYCLTQANDFFEVFNFHHLLAVNPQWKNEIKNYFKNNFWAKVIKILNKLNSESTNSLINKMGLCLPVIQFVASTLKKKDERDEMQTLLKEVELVECNKSFIKLVYENFPQLQGDDLQ